MLHTLSEFSVWPYLLITPLKDCRFIVRSDKSQICAIIDEKEHLSVDVTHRIGYTLQSHIRYRIIGHVYIIKLNVSREQLLKLSIAPSKHWNLISTIK